MEETILTGEFGQAIADLNLTPRRFQNITFRAVDFVETFFKPRWDRFNPIVLTPSQRDIIDSTQFGFPLRYYSFNEVPNPPKIVIVISPRQFGKSISVSAAGGALALQHPYHQIGMIGSSEKASKKLLQKTKWFIEHSVFKDSIVGSTKQSLDLNNGSLIESYPGNDSIRGEKIHWLLADEVRDMDQRVLFESALPTTRHGYRTTMITTPPDAHKKFLDYYYKGLESRPIICTSCGESFTQKMFNVTEFPINMMPLNLHPCIECGETTYKYGVGEIMVPYVDPWNTPLFTKQEITKILDFHGWSPEARKEYLGEIIKEFSQVFLEKWFTAATAFGEELRLANVLRRKKGLVYVIGVDYGRKHDASVFCVTHYDRKQARIIVDYMESIAGEFDQERTYKAIQKRLFKIIKFFQPHLLVLDATGLGDPLVEEIENDLTDAKIRTKILNYPSDKTKGFIISRKSKPELMGETIKRLRAVPCQIAIPPLMDPEIGEFVKECLRFECDTDKYTGYTKFGTQSYHDDRVIAFCLSVWGHRQPIWYNHEYKMVNYSNMLNLDTQLF